MGRAPRWIDRLALLAVPPDWRSTVARDLDDEVNQRRITFLAHALLIGLRLRAARVKDRFAPASGLARPTTRRVVFMHDITRDLRLALRSIIRHPGYALAVIATLAIGIGANTAIFSVFNSILFRPLPGVAHPEELVTIRYQRPKFEGQFFVSYRDYADVRDGIPALAAVAASSALKMDVSVGRGPERLLAEVVTANYFSFFGVTPTLGRDFAPSEEAPGSHSAAVVSARYSRRAFGNEASAIGKTISLYGKPFTVVGVAPARFQGSSSVTRTDVWIPLGAYPTLQPRMTKLLTSRQQTFFGDSFGRLREGATLVQAQQQAAALVASTPEFGGGRRSNSPGNRLTPVLTPGINLGAYTETRLRTIFRLLMGAVGLLLILACANAGNLLLARATGRRREIAVCQAIGASRGRIVRQQLAEALTLSLTAGITGLGLAVWLTSLFDGMAVVSSMPALQDVTVDWRVSAFALAASMVTAVVFATVPAIVGSRVDLQASLKNGITASRGRRRLLRSSLVTVQVMVSVMLLIAAGLFVRTLQNIRSLDLGLQTDGVISLAVDPSRYGYQPDRAKAYIQSLLERLRQAPGVESAAFTWTTSFIPNRDDVSVLLPDGSTLSAAETYVSPGFFRTMRIPLLAGRDFTDHDLETESDTLGTIVVSRQFASKLFPNGDAVGSRVTLSYPKGKVVEVIGIVGDVRGRPLTENPEPWAYTPAAAMSWGTIQVRSALRPDEAIATITQTARAVDPLVMPFDIEVFDASIDRALSEQRLFARLSTVFGAIGALLAGIGIYGMMTGAVAERRKEFGIRLALGAPGHSVLALVLRMALTLAMMGVVLGVLAAVGLQRFVEARLFGVTPLDPMTIAGTIACTVGLGVVGSLVPALRASRMDPVRSLRVE